MLICIDTGDQGPSNQMNIALFMPCQIADHHFFFNDYPLQEAWKRNTVVKRVRFISQEMNTTIRVMLAQRLRCCCTCNTISYDDIVSFTIYQKRPSLSGISTAISLNLIKS